VFTNLTVNQLYSFIETKVSAVETPAHLQAGSFKLYANYPNPFNPVTTLRYELDESGSVNLTVYNAAGEKVQTLVSGRQAAGFHSIRFDGKEFSSGVYFYQLNTRFGSEIHKMILLK